MVWLYIFTLGCPILFIGGLIFAPSGIWKMGRRLSDNDNIKTSVERTQKEELSIIEQNITNNVTDDGSYQLSKIGSAIDYAIGRHDWYENQRSVIFRYLLTVSGLVFTGIGIYAKVYNTLTHFEIFAILSIGITVVIAVFVALHFYNSELDQDRPYRLVSDICHWYFRYPLPKRAAHVGERLDIENIANEVLAERDSYMKRVMKFTSLSKSIREDLEQLFILHVLQRYKHESLSKMRWLFSYFIGMLFFEEFGFLF